MEGFDWPLKFILSFVLGAVIGLEREINEKKVVKGEAKTKAAIIGLRTFSLVAGMGTLVGLFYPTFPLIAVLGASILFLLILVYYIFDSWKTLDLGFTTELALIYSFVIGFLLAVNVVPIQLIIALTVVLVLLMSRKEDIKNLVEEIKQTEINAFISFAILAFVILPFLPNKNFALSDFGNTNEILKNVGINLNQFANLQLFNPFKLWMIVVLITGVDLLGYILERTIGSKRGWLIASLAGGFVSSTSTTISIAQESKHNKNLNSLLAAAVFANFVSFIPITFLLITLNPALFINFFIPLLSIFIASGCLGFYFYFQAKKEKVDSIDKHQVQTSHNIFDLVSALKFVGIFLLVNIVSKVALELFGNTGFLIASAMGALPGIDAVVINTASLAGSQVSFGVAVWALILINSVNLLAKSVYSFLQGSKAFAFQFFISMLIIISVSAVVTLGAFLFMIR